MILSFERHSMKKIATLVLVMTIIISATSCKASEPKRYQAEFLTLFDTVTRIVGYADSVPDTSDYKQNDEKEKFSALAQSIYDRLEQYHKLYDIYNDYAEINNIKTINDNAGKAPVKVDSRIIELLSFSKEMYEKSDGVFNIAFGSVLVLWHDAREAGTEDPENAELPSNEELEEAAKHCDINDIIIDKEASTVFLSDPDMRLDVGAVAKGYATEQVAKWLEDEGVTSLLVSVGGNVRAIGGKYNSSGKFDQPWSIGIQNPDQSAENTELFSVDVTGKSVVTSGIYERYFTVDGKQYHHIIDTKTLMPSEYYSSMTVVCSDSGLADALTTALFNIPIEKAKEKVKMFDGVEAFWVMLDGTTVSTEGFERLIHKTE